jgi:hypothetical protein
MRYLVFNATDGVYASPDIFTRPEAEAFIAEFREWFTQPGYYKTSEGKYIRPAQIDLQLEEFNG